MAKARLQQNNSPMGTFYTRCKVENVVNREQSAIIRRLLVDTDSDYSWIPATALEKIGVVREKKDIPFVMANGQQITRSLEGLNLRVDPRHKKLVAAGPLLAASSSTV